jgi:hypothetical protein
MWVIHPEKFSLAFFHWIKTLISNRFPDHSRNSPFRGNYFPENETLVKKSPDNSPGTSPYKKFGKENVRQLKRISCSNSVKTPSVTFPLEYSFIRNFPPKGGFSL